MSVLSLKGTNIDVDFAEMIPQSYIQNARDPISAIFRTSLGLHLSLCAFLATILLFILLNILQCLPITR